jgi:hypothetical protein
MNSISAIEMMDHPLPDGCEYSALYKIRPFDVFVKVITHEHLMVERKTWQPLKTTLWCVRDDGTPETLVIDASLALPIFILKEVP